MADLPTSGYPRRMLAIVYSSYDTATTVWAFVLSALIVLTVAWYVRRRR
ncbi:hypothetical protein ACFWFC_20120 [Streptomyces venezuelae]